MKRLKEISLFEVVLCMCVIMIHVLSGCIDGYIKGSFLSAAAFSLSRAITFAVPAFIMSSGIKMSSKFADKPLNYISFMKGRLKKVYLPYLLWSIVYYLYFVFHRDYFPFNINKLLLYLLNGEVAAPFYFILVIMQFYIFMPLWIKMFKKISPLRGILIAALITILSKYLTYPYPFSNRLFTNYLMFWVMGCYIGSDYTRAMAFISKHKAGLAVSAVLFTFLYVALAYMEFMGILYLFTTEIAKLIFCSTVSLTLLYICRVLTEKPNSAPITQAYKLAPLTFYVYLIHCLIILETDNLMLHLGIYSVSAMFVVRLFTAYIFSFAISKIYANMKKKLLQK